MNASSRDEAYAVKFPTPVRRRTQTHLNSHVPQTRIAIHQANDEDYIVQSDQVNVQEAEQRKVFGAGVLCGLILSRFL